MIKSFLSILLRGFPTEPFSLRWLSFDLILCHKVFFDQNQWISTRYSSILVFDHILRNESVFDQQEALSTVAMNNHMTLAFQETTLPADSRLVGWANLVRRFDVSVPVRRPSVVSTNYVKGSRREEGASVGSRRRDRVAHCVRRCHVCLRLRRERGVRLAHTGR